MIQKITQAEIDQNAVAALSDRPGAPSRYGTGGLSAGALKARFDALALLAITKLNALIDALHGAGEGNPLIDEMTTHAVSLLNENERIPLSEWIERVETFLGLSGTGGLAARVAALEALQIPDDVPTLLKGLHPDLVAGLAENLCGRPNDETGACFTHRPTRDAGDVGRGNVTIRCIRGKTLIWNQMVGALTPSSINDLTVSFTGGVLTVSGTASANTNLKLIDSDDFTNGHKYLVCGVPTGGSSSTYGGYWSNSGLFYSDNIITYNSNGSLNIRIISGATVNLSCILQVFDLTAVFGAGNEPSTVAAFKALFPLNYYAYNAGSLLNFNGTGLKTVGFNAYNNGTAYVLGGQQYQITGSYTTLSLDGTTVTPNGSGIFTPAKNGTLTVTGGDGTTCVHLTHSGWRNGEYEAYWESTLTLPVSTYFATGMKSVGPTYDELTETKAIQRIGSRAYTAGDESDSSVVTDGTTTYYVLGTPVETDIDISLIYRADDFGTEKLLPENGAEPATSPLVGRVLYPLNAVDTVRNLPRNYISLSTFDKLRTALAGDYTVTRTWNATTNDYDVTASRVGGVWRHDISAKNSDDEWLYFTTVNNSATQVTCSGSAFSGLPNGYYAAYNADYGAGTVQVSSGAVTFFHGSSSKTWDGSGGLTDAVTKLY